MGDSAVSRIKNDVLDSPAVERLREELRLYLTARAEAALRRLGERLGETVAGWAEPGSGRGSLAKGLERGRRALEEGRTPAAAALTAGAHAAKDSVKASVKASVKKKAREVVGVAGAGRGSDDDAGKRVAIVEEVDVGVPVREAYDQWTRFHEFSVFAKGVVAVATEDDTTTDWTVRVAGATRTWRAHITEQIPDKRMAWITEGAKGTVRGVVTFHRLADDLTRVLLVLEYFPRGLLEKLGNVWRVPGRRARLDLQRYRAFLMLRGGEAEDGWRGEIRDGEVVVGHDEAVEEEQEYADGDGDGIDAAEPVDDGYEDDAYEDDEDGPDEEEDELDQEEAEFYDEDEDPDRR